MRASFPSTTIEEADYWKDLAMLDRTVVFDRAMIVSRETSGRQYVLFLHSFFTKCKFI
jgi:protein O-GlcNAc transferase